MTNRPNLIVFSDDWGRHPSSCQHLTSHLLDDFNVTWLNTIGTRPPRLDLATVSRCWEKVRHWAKRSSGATGSSRDTPRVISPMMWPSFRTKWQRHLNRALLLRCLQLHVPEPRVILTTVPIVADLIGHVANTRWIYYCVDDFSEWPGLDGETLEKMEAALIDGVDTIVAAGENLADRIRRRGRDATIITHGVDVDHWRSNTRTNVPEALKSLERPLALFWGLIDQRLDVKWLQTLANSMSSGSIALVGPQQAPDPALRLINRLHFTGPLPYEQLPSAAAAADVLIMPYADLPVTRAMQPLKLKEYLATGKPVVVRRLPSVVPWENELSAVSSAETFAAAVTAQFGSKLATVPSAGFPRLQNEHWRSKANELRQILIGN